MEKLKVKFRRIDNTVMMKVIQQDESTRGVGIIFEHDGIKIRSSDMPEISEESIYVRGDDLTEDKDIKYYQFKEVDEAKEYIKKAKACIKAYNDSLEEKEEVVEKEEGRWIPNYDESYYFVESNYSIGLTSFENIWKADKTGEYRLRTNNCFETEEEAERAVEIEKKKMELSKIFTKEEWLDRNVGKFYISYNVCERKCRINSNISYNTNQTTFPSETKAQEFFDFCGADDYEKYVLGVY